MDVSFPKNVKISSEPATTTKKKRKIKYKKKLVNINNFINNKYFIKIDTIIYKKKM